MKILVTGAAGTIGTVLMDGLAKDHELIGVDRVAAPGVTMLDLADRGEATLTTLGRLFVDVETVIHLAWDTKESTTKLDEIFTDPEHATAHRDNLWVGESLLWAAHQAGVRRFIFASSVHAALGHVAGYEYPISQDHREHHDVLHRDQKISVRNGPAPSGGVYGATKAYFESLGYSFAKTHGVEFVAIRFGNVRRDDSAKDSEYPLYLSHRDCVQFVLKCLTTELPPHSIFFAISDNACNPFSQYCEKAILGYSPRDGTLCPFGMA